MTSIDASKNINKTVDGVGLEPSLDHNKLLNYEASRHVDWTNTTQNLTTTGNIQANSFMTKGLSAGTFVGFQKSGDDAELTFATDTNSDGVANYIVDVVMPQSSASGFWGWVERTNALTSPLLSYTFTTQVLQFIGKGGIRISSGSSTAGTLINNFIGTTASSIISAPVSISPNSVNTRVQVNDTETIISNTLRYTGDTPVSGYILTTDISGNLSYVDSPVKTSSYTTTFSGLGFTTTSLTIQITKYGNVVTLGIPLFSGTATVAGLFQSTTAIPAEYRPASIQMDICQIVDNGIRAVGTINMQTNGLLLLTPSLLGAWSGSGTSGIAYADRSFTYTILG